MLSRYFFLLAPLAALLGFLFPNLFQALTSAIVPMLMLVMLTMGLTLKFSSFVQVGSSWKALVLGLSLQFSVMPLVALSLSEIFAFDDELTVGMILLGSVAGGVASNVITYLAQGNVALSISMTAFSTLFSIVLTPLILSQLTATNVDVPTEKMLYSLMQIILVPIALGMLLNYFLADKLTSYNKFVPEFAVLVILLIIAIVLSLNANNIKATVLIVGLATLLHNIIGMLLGYGIAKGLHQDAKTCRTIAIEVGMQNSAMATALALKYFSAVSALPGIFFSIWLNITGSLFAKWCNRQDELDQLTK